MATGKLRHRKTRVSPLSAYRSGGDHKRSLWQLAGGALFALLVSSATVSAQDEGAPPGPIPGAPTTAPPDTEEQEAEEVVEEERRMRPFFRPEPSLTERLLPDATPELSNSLLFPTNALEGVRRPERALQVGRFAISPRIDVGAAYDDNTEASNTDREDDITANLRGGVRADSLFERHSLGFEASAAIADPHRSFSSDTVSVASRADGRLDLTRRSSLAAEAGFTRGAQSPEEREAGAEDEPTILGATGAIAYRQSFARLGWQVAGGINRTEADDGEEAAEQDRTSFTISPGVDYQISRRVTLFAEPGYARNDYDIAGEGGSRDSQTVRADIGTEIEFGRTFAARTGIGYVGVFFDDSERDDYHAPSFTGDLNGAISLDRLTLLGVGLNHSTDVTTEDDAALVATSRFSTFLNRLLTPAAAILARVDLSRSDFIDEDRTDHDIIAELAYSHNLIRNVAMNLTYRFSRRFADDDEDEFYRNVVSIGLSAAF